MSNEVVVDDDIPRLIAENCKIESDSSDDDDEQWMEEDEENHETRCLFTNKVFASIEEAIEFLKINFNFDLCELKRKHEMDFYSYIKLINFIRTQKIETPAQLYGEDGKTPLWLGDKFLKPPSDDFEPWLSYDFDNLDIAETISDDAKVIRDLRSELAVKDQLLQQAFDDKETMKEAFIRIMNDSTAPSSSMKAASSDDNVASKPIEQDNAYFESYSHFEIHHTMLSDKVRTDCYRDAILKNSETFKNKIVLDVGCGTSILSMFAAQAGAEKVLSIDQSDVIYCAMEIARTNGFDNIEFIKGRLEDIKLPVDKVDIIISEWMGYFLLFEGMLDSVIYARNNYLKEGGHILPNRCSISIVGYGNEKQYGEVVEYFKNVYGFNMSCMIKDVLSEGHIDACEEKYVLTKPNEILSLDLMTCDLTYTKFSYDFNLLVTKDGKLNSIVGYFDCVFDLPQTEVLLTTSPNAPQTHWKQVCFYFDQVVDVKVGDVVTGNLTCRRDRKDLRSLNVQIEMFGKTYKYKIE